MARYLWECTQCKKPVEVERAMKDYQVPPEEKCECGGAAYERVIEPTRFILQGGGWHKDEYTKYRSIK